MGYSGHMIITRNYFKLRQIKWFSVISFKTQNNISRTSSDGLYNNVLFSIMFVQDTWIFDLLSFWVQLVCVTSHKKKSSWNDLYILTDKIRWLSLYFPYFTLKLRLKCREIDRGFPFIRIYVLEDKSQTQSEMTLNVRVIKGLHQNGWNKTLWHTIFLYTYIHTYIHTHIHNWKYYTQIEMVWTLRKNLRMTKRGMTCVYE
jgi:hypothetical protein